MKKIFSLFVFALMLMLHSACNRDPPHADDGEAKLLTEVKALVEAVEAELETGYTLQPSVWNQNQAVITIKVTDPDSDFKQELDQLVASKPIQAFEQDLLISFEHDKALTSEERARGLSSNTLMLETVDAKTGKTKQ